MEGAQDVEQDLRIISNYRNILDSENIIIGGDLNAKSPWWGCDVEDRRGTAISESFAQLELHILNTGKTPTFWAHRGNRDYTSIVDVTACSNDLLNKITNWRVNPDFVTLSDHRAITFSVNLEKITAEATQRQTTRIYNTGKADWASFTHFLKEELKVLKITEESITEIGNTDALEDLVQQYVDCILRSSDKAIPKLAKTISAKTPWWTKQLSDKKKDVIRKRRKIKHANQNRRQSVIEDYITAKAEYKNLLTDTLTSSWKDFCKKQDRENLWQGIYRIIRKSSRTPEDTLLRETTTSKIMTPEESAKILSETFYPYDDIETDEQPHSEMRQKAETIKKEWAKITKEDTTKPFTNTEVEFILQSMSPRKSPGEDSLTADICYKAYAALPQILLAIYNKCLALGHFPKIWKSAIIKVIPKPNKENYTLPKSYRPIGLLPVLGKGLEKLFVNRMTWQIGSENKMSGRQYGFVSQRGTEDALCDALEVVRQGLKNSEIVVIVSIDIEGAFDNAWWPAMINELDKKKVDKSVCRLIGSYLTDRQIKLTYAGSEIIKQTNKGCIQGSICGPLLWNLQLDPLLREVEELGTHIQAYADDILVIAKGKAVKDLEQELNTALDHILAWAKTRKMRLAAQKTQAILLTRKLKYETPSLSLDNKAITFSNSITILGLTIDANLNFVKHVDVVTEKAIQLYKKVSRTARANWGLNSEILRTIYITVVEPTILYAAGAWGTTANKKQIKTRLDRITRTFAIMHPMFEDMSETAWNKLFYVLA
ncbi:unnamed protein product [Parnassius mnemosyne]|uniref:Reverse transcriptase domain-containing protein n=1 Tax=Parnassius mnemosyne TaxID=213953 RepID=A0AAV1KCJ3_9NEOP